MGVSSSKIPRDINTCTMESIDTSTTTNCAACGKEGGNLNTCNKCKMVKYCNAACKKKHRSKHKKACERRVAELHDEELFKDPPPREECPICLLPLPLDATQKTFHCCCGKTICNGCVYAMFKEALGRGGELGMCAFCRKPKPNSVEDEIKWLMKLVDADNGDAVHALASLYFNGLKGMPQDTTKANELILRAGELGCVDAYFNLGLAYEHGRGVEMDKKKAKHFYELAAMNGDVNARHNLGSMEAEAGNVHRAYLHFLLAAKAGFKMSLDQVKQRFMDGMVTKDEYANTLRAFQSRQDEMKSDTRGKAEILGVGWQSAFIEMSGASSGMILE